MTPRTRNLALVAGGLLLVAASVGVAVWRAAPKGPVIIKAGEEAPPEAEKVVEILEAGPHAQGAVPDGPNVVLIIGCTLRRDQTSAYGLPVDTTPWLAKLAEDGVRFEDGVAVAPWTKAAATGILTGRHPSEIGMVEPGEDGNKRVLSTEVPTLAERMGAAGYTTLGGSANPNLNAVFGFDQGFDRYAQSSKLWREGGRSFRGPASARVVDELLRDRPAPERPVYLQLTLIDAHTPYPQYSSFQDENVSKRVNRYRSAVNKLDRSLGNIEQTLTEHGLTRENTVFMVVNDHGEGLNHPDHHGRGHGRHLSSSAVGMVWIAAGPGIPAGTRVNGLASGVDVGATLLGLVGIDDDVPGMDHSDAIRSGGQTARDRAWTNTWYKDVNRTAVYSDAWMCQADRAESEGQVFKTGCFDRASDPMHERLTQQDGLMGELMLWRGAQDDRVREVTAVDAEPTEAIEDQLRALGYVD